MSNPRGQPASFSRGALAHLQLALGTTLRSRQGDQTALQGALERLCAEAHAIGLALGDTLDVLDALWLPVASGSPTNDERTRAVRNRVVAACIATYVKSLADG
jgi:hypothetical protein